MMPTETLYKITNCSGHTRGNTSWGEGTTHQVKWSGAMCTEGCLHAYRSPELAVLMDPIHGQYFPHGSLWKAKGVVRLDDGTKVGCARLTTVEIIKKPIITKEQLVEIAIRCVMTKYKDEYWTRWAIAWLDGSDRSLRTAEDVRSRVPSMRIRPAEDACWAAVAAAKFNDKSTAWFAAWAVEEVSRRSNSCLAQRIIESVL